VGRRQISHPGLFVLQREPGRLDRQSRLKQTWFDGPGSNGSLIWPLIGYRVKGRTSLTQATLPCLTMTQK